MNLEREREIFIDWHFNKYYAKDADKEFLYEMFEDKNEFVSYEVQHSWVAWLASASRDGYKLVPVETLEECLSWADVAKWDSPSKERDQEIHHHERIIESMLGAVE